MTERSVDELVDLARTQSPAYRVERYRGRLAAYGGPAVESMLALREDTVPGYFAVTVLDAMADHGVEGASSCSGFTRRPAELTFTFPDGSSQKVKLEDIPGSQTFALSASNADSVVITATATNGLEAAPISISEIEFFKKS